MIDAVLTHPHHPDLCGVVKFSVLLGEKLGVPCYRNLGAIVKHPLLSVKGAEGDLTWKPRPAQSYDVFAHDAQGVIPYLARWARHVYAANEAIADSLRSLRPDVQLAWCPPLIQGNPTRGKYNVLTFGMAHKLRMDDYRALKADLDAEYGDDYTLSVSTAVHEGSPWDATARVADQLRAIFGAKLRVLGYLADDALVREVDQADAIALFFDPALRANNTTYHFAKSRGKHVITNRDALSPAIDGDYSWDRLLEVMRGA